MSIKAVKAVIMDLLMSGRFTSECDLSFSFCWFVTIVNMLLKSNYFFCLYVCSTLGGSHGVPRAHYKGRQGDYYVMVCHEKEKVFYKRDMDFVFIL